MEKGRSIGELEEDPGGVVVCPLRIHDSKYHQRESKICSVNLSWQVTASICCHQHPPRPRGKGEEETPPGATCCSSGQFECPSSSSSSTRKVVIRFGWSNFSTRVLLPARPLIWWVEPFAAACVDKNKRTAAGAHQMCPRIPYATIKQPISI